MIFTRIKIDNLYTFNNAELELSFKRKPSFSTLEGEHLYNRKNYYFKKVSILSGTNSSGKTSLGKILRDIQNYILKNCGLVDIGEKIYDKTKNGTIEVDYATIKPKPIAHRLKIDITINNLIDKISYVNTPIGLNDSCFKIRKKIDHIFSVKKAPKGSNFIERWGEEVINFAFKFFEDNDIVVSWYYLFSENYQENFSIQHTLDLKVMKNVLSSFDYTIDKVSEISIDEGNGVKNITGHRIYFKNKDSVDIDETGDIVKNKNRLSKGTFDAIKIASLIGKIKQEKKIRDSDINKVCSTYFLDEKMSYIHSELEVAIVNLIINNMGNNCQFFYTTHNYEVLDLNLPIHSFTFLNKIDGKSIFVEAQENYKKNDRNLVNHIKNNFFQTLPSTHFLDELLED